MDKRFHTGQYGQSEMIDQLCYPNGVGNHVGTFIEIGAWNGVELSNSYHLEKVRGWNGLLVEPLAEEAEQAQHNRWCQVWNGCMWDEDGEMDFLKIDGYSRMLSGIEEGYHPSHRARIEKELDDHKQNSTRIRLPCSTLNSLMSRFNLPAVDLLSLDTQTSELKILRSVDPNKTPVKAILLDFNGYNVEELKTWFTTHGYKLHWKHPQADEYLYIRPDLRWSWE